MWKGAKFCWNTYSFYLNISSMWDETTSSTSMYLWQHWKQCIQLIITTSKIIRVAGHPVCNTLGISERSTFNLLPIFLVDFDLGERFSHQRRITNIGFYVKGFIFVDQIISLCLCRAEVTSPQNQQFISNVLMYHISGFHPSIWGFFPWLWSLLSFSRIIINNLLNSLDK